MGDQPCPDCGQTGRRRAQLVLTMANLDTGAVASANVVPGVVEPVRWPGNGQRWCLPLAPLLRELAATVDVGSWSDVRQPGSPDGPLVLLPRGWRPELPDASRRTLEAEALAGEAREPWRLYLGRTVAAPPRDPAAELGRRCRLAGLLCLDLVVEARRRASDGAGFSWYLRYEVPGGPVPCEPGRDADNLAQAIAATGDLDALYGLEERGRHVPAYYLDAGDRPPADPPRVDLDRLERRILADCVDLATGAPTAGAQAIWRDGRWWHTTLHADTAEIRTERPAGQLCQRRRAVLRRGWEPPAPSWRGAPVPSVDCPDCAPDFPLRRCDCRLGAGRIDPDCPTCGGSGRAPLLLPCRTCRDTHRLHDGVTVTITDLTSLVVHLTWRVDAAGWQAGELVWWADDGLPQAGEHIWRAGLRLPAPVVATHPGGAPLHQLPAPFRLGGWAHAFGVRPEDLVELDGGGDVDRDLRNGTVTLHRAGDEPLTAYLRQVGRGRPGARRFVLARRPDVPPVADLVRLVLGLRLAITVTLTDHAPDAGDLRLGQGESWDVTIRPPGAPVVPADPPTRATPEAAVAFCLDYLELVIAGSVPDDPIVPIPVPQAPTPAVVHDPVPLLRRLARHHAGQPVAVHYEGGTCQVWLRDRDDVRHIATAATLPAAVHALGL